MSGRRDQLRYLLSGLLCLTSVGVLFAPSDPILAPWRIQQRLVTSDELPSASPRHLSAWLELTNRSRVEQTVLNVIPRVPCMRITGLPVTIPPGGSTVIRIDAMVSRAGRIFLDILTATDRTSTFAILDPARAAFMNDSRPCDWEPLSSTHLDPVPWEAN